MTVWECYCHALENGCLSTTDEIQQISGAAVISPSSVGRTDDGLSGSHFVKRKLQMTLVDFSVLLIGSKILTLVSEQRTSIDKEDRGYLSHSIWWPLVVKFFLINMYLEEEILWSHPLTHSLILCEQWQQIVNATPLSSPQPVQLFLELIILALFLFTFDSTCCVFA